MTSPNADEWATATFGGGCFWCLEAVYQRIKGVKKVIPGYAGGHTEDPSYEAVSSGTTSHAEVVQIHYDPNVITYEDLLYIFWRLHDPTQLNRQGNDVGPQYRSIILPHNEQQRDLAEQSRKATDASDLWPDEIVTEIKPLETFYAAEEYHHDYYNENRSKNPYCRFVIDPKIEKLKKDYQDYLKENAAAN